MRLRSCTKLLTLIYAFSITAFGIMEGGHEVMHAVKNTFHYHAAHEHHVLEDHSAFADHDKSFADSLIATIVFGFLFFEVCCILLIGVAVNLQFYSPDSVCPKNVSRNPFIPPPISTRSFHF
jgi:hypothetical protein